MAESQVPRLELPFFAPDARSGGLRRVLRALAVLIGS